ncbi:YcdB/YcdC domain-containing protein [Brevibacillus sp. DP1.3A]|uniref:YcdB/YcdC domain-containing protein n=1 Tax=Brevibacillus sp. DP1.3A TaxID=2738867 RepID=UPI00156BBA3D|nr:YcdB/YcdC domain-containing protein [Brevibacillus sp. DP1.3A]UED75802.1 hypothetical protein HP399_004715 [Brevibacillus sp. DP1.3A]
MIAYPTEAVRGTMERWFGLFPGLREISPVQIRTDDAWRTCEIKIGHDRTELEIDKETGYVMEFDLDRTYEESIVFGERIDAESATERAIEVAEKLYGDHLKEMVRDHVANLSEYREKKQWELYYRYVFHGIPLSGVHLRIALDEWGNFVGIYYRGYHDFDRKNKPSKPEVITKEEAEQAYIALLEKNMMLTFDEQEEGRLKYIPDEAPLEYVVIHAETGQIGKSVIGSRKTLENHSEVIPVFAQGESIFFADIQEIELWVKEHFQIDVTHSEIERATVVTPNEDGVTFYPRSGYFRFVDAASQPDWPPTIHYYWPLPEDEDAETMYDPDFVCVTLNRTTNELLAFTVNQKKEYKTPRLSEYDALQIAKSFLEKYIEKGINELHYFELFYLRGTGNTYYFYERRQGIVLTSRMYSVKVNPWTGQVTGFYKHDVRKNKEIPDPASCVSTREAAKSFLSLREVELEYVQVENRSIGRRDKAPVPFPVYGLKYTGRERYKYLDAITNQFHPRS